MQPSQQQAYQQNSYKPRLGYKGDDEQVMGKEEKYNLESKLYLMTLSESGLKSQIIIEDNIGSGKGEYENSKMTSTFKKTSSFIKRDIFANEEFSQQLMDNEKMISSDLNQQIHD